MVLAGGSLGAEGLSNYAQRGGEGHTMEVSLRGRSQWKELAGEEEATNLTRRRLWELTKIDPSGGKWMGTCAPLLQTKSEPNVGTSRGEKTQFHGSVCLNVALFLINVSNHRALAVDKILWLIIIGCLDLKRRCMFLIRNESLAAENWF